MIIRHIQTKKESEIQPNKWKDYKETGLSDFYVIVDWGDVVELFVRKAGRLVQNLGLFNRDHALRVISMNEHKYFLKEVDHSQLERAEKSRDPLENPDIVKDDHKRYIKNDIPKKSDNVNEIHSNKLIRILANRLLNRIKTIPNRLFFVIKISMAFIHTRMPSMNNIDKVVTVLGFILALYVAYKQGLFDNFF